jgi:hypothetical protein
LVTEKIRSCAVSFRTVEVFGGKVLKVRVDIIAQVVWLILHQWKNAPVAKPFEQESMKTQAFRNRKFYPAFQQLH